MRTRHVPGLATALLATAALGGCLAADTHLFGPALWPLVISGQADDFAGEMVLAAVADVVPPELETAPQQDAQVTARLELAIPLLAVGPGMYTGAFGRVQRLGLAPLAVTEVRAHWDGRTHSVAGPIAEPVASATTSAVVPSGVPVLLDLPDDYGERFDQVVVFVADGDGTVRYDTVPDTLDEWLDFASTKDTPDPVRVPASALEVGQQLISVVALRRGRDEARFSSGLHSELSGFTSGTAVSQWVEVTP